MTILPYLSLAIFWCGVKDRFTNISQVNCNIAIEVILTDMGTVARYQYYVVIMSVIASQITCLTIVYSVYSGTDQRKH